MAVMLQKATLVKDEKTFKSVGDEDGGKTEKVGSEMLICSEEGPKPSSLSQSHVQSCDKQEDQLESTKKEMGEVKEENERLKMAFTQIVKDYQSLQTHFFDVVHQEQPKKPTGVSPVPNDIEDPELVALSLGTSSTGHKKENTRRDSKSNDDDEIKEGLTLRLDCKFERSSSSPIRTPSNVSPENSNVDMKEKEAVEPWPPSKIWKNVRSGEEENSQQTHAKRARVSVRARCGDPMIHDGCQWRKYGQKTSKGNPCPRAYYRCTVAPACPVRKQVQRFAEDTSILITTYEGIHNHPLPASAAAMASTTSAAACMLMSGSSTSHPAAGSSMSFPSITSATTTPNLHGLNFPLENSTPAQFYLPNSSNSSSFSHPTITLDLTTPPSSSNFTLTPSSSHSSTCFNFSSSYPDAMQTRTRQYSSCQTGSLSFGKQSQENFYQSYVQKAASQSLSLAQTSLTDTIAKAITSDPSFQSAVAAAITSYVGARGAEGSSSGSGSGNSLNWGEHLASALSMGNGTFASSISTGYNPSSPNHQQGNSTFLQLPLALCGSNSASTSPGDSMEHLK